MMLWYYSDIRQKLEPDTNMKTIAIVVGFLAENLELISVVFLAALVYGARWVRLKLMAKGTFDKGVAFIVLFLILMAFLLCAVGVGYLNLILNGA
jgi:hypothetical protein